LPEKLYQNGAQTKALGLPKNATNRTFGET
jgi:hypothetical protein